MENNLTYFIPDIILIAGIILSAVLCLHPKLKAFLNSKPPKLFVIFLNSVLVLVLLGFMPHITDFLRLTNIDLITSHFPPFEDYRQHFLYGAFCITPLRIFFQLIITVSAVVTAFLSAPFIKVLNKKLGYFVTLFLFAVLGAFLTALSNDFITLFISLEILSAALCFMIMCFDTKKDTKKAALESAVKFLTFDIFASCFMLLGIGFIYLSLGTINFSDINTLTLNKILPSTPFLNLAEVIFFVSLAFKIGAFPLYIPFMDIYKGANYAPGLFMSTILPITGSIALINTCSVLGFFGSVLNFALILCAILTLVIGNLLILRIVKKIEKGDSSIKAFLAASTMANTGYIFLGTAFMLKGTLCAALYFLIIFMIMNFGLQSGFMLIVKNLKGGLKDGGASDETLGSIKGLAYISPFFAHLMTLCLLSFAGLAPLAGFSAKFYLFCEILRSGIWACYPLFFAAFAAILGFYSYFKIIFYMFKKPENTQIFKKNHVFNRSNICTITLSVCVVLLIAGFFFSAPLIDLINNLI